MRKRADDRTLCTGPQEALLIERMRQMSEAEQSQVVRFLLRLLNDDKKVLRLVAMEKAGQITARQLLKMV